MISASGDLANSNAHFLLFAFLFSAFLDNMASLPLYSGTSQADLHHMHVISTAHRIIIIITLHRFSNHINGRHHITSNHPAHQKTHHASHHSAHHNTSHHTSHHVSHHILSHPTSHHTSTSCKTTHHITEKRCSITCADDISQHHIATHIASDHKSADGSHQQVPAL